MCYYGYMLISWKTRDWRIVTMSEQMTYVTIGDLAKKAQVSLQTLRRWDRIGKLKPVMTLNNGTRLYTPEQVDQCIESRKQELLEKLKALENPQ